MGKVEVFGEKGKELLSEKGRKGIIRIILLMYTFKGKRRPQPDANEESRIDRRIKKNRVDDEMKRIVAKEERLVAKEERLDDEKKRLEKAKVSESDGWQRLDAQWQRLDAEKQALERDQDFMRQGELSFLGHVDVDVENSVLL